MGDSILIISGRGDVRHKDGTTEVVAGDAFIFGPDEPHQLSNSGTDDFVYYVIADNPIGESAYYPDSGKWKVNKSSARIALWSKGKKRITSTAKNSLSCVEAAVPRRSQKCRRHACRYTKIDIMIRRLTPRDARLSSFSSYARALGT